MRDEQGREPELGLKTERLRASDLARAAELLRAGGTVAFPTETVYGLGANALDAASVEKIFTAKQRPAWDPVIVHVEGRAMLERVAEIPAGNEGRVVAKLMETFWPGPLTLLLPQDGCGAGLCDRGTAAGGRALAGAPGGAGVDRAGRHANRST